MLKHLIPSHGTENCLDDAEEVFLMPHISWWGSVCLISTIRTQVRIRLLHFLNILSPLSTKSLR